MKDEQPIIRVRVNTGESMRLQKRAPGNVSVCESKRLRKRAPPKAGAWRSQAPA